MLQFGHVNARNQCNWYSVWNHEVLSNVLLHTVTQQLATSNTHNYSIFNVKH